MRKLRVLILLLLFAAITSVSAYAAGIPSKKEPHYIATALFSGGCFWGMEHGFENRPGVIRVTSGYTGGKTDHPSYPEVSAGNTGYAEAIKVEYDPSKITYEKLAKLFFEIHDPTQLNRQGPDIGSQYRSAIFYGNNEEKKTAIKLIAKLKSFGYKVITQVEPAGKFYPAEEYHQDYYERTGGQPYCHIYRKRFRD